MVEGIAPLESRLLAEHVSRALPEIVRDINKPSDNTLARTVFLSLGALETDPVLGSRPVMPAPGETTLLRAPTLVVRDWLRQHGIDDAGLVMDNGSGLSRTASASARRNWPACCRRACAATVDAGVSGQHADRGR